MNYQYSGYLSTILYKPDEAIRDSLDHVEFSGERLAQWRAQDLDFAVECRDIQVKKSATATGVIIEGDFRTETRIDSLSPNDPRYWVPLSTVEARLPEFPIDVSKYPVIEVTYRCASPRAHPTWMWTYEGGSHFGALPKSQDWITVARNVQHFGFPARVNDVVIRLYSPTRTVESLEVSDVRFRAMSKAEEEALRKSYVQLDEQKATESFQILDEFLPLGVYMDADSAKRLAEMLGISVDEYWELVMQDLVSHHHNTIALAHVDQLRPQEWLDMQRRAETYGLRFVPRHEFPIGGPVEEQKRVIETHIKPYAQSNAILANMISGEPIESDLNQVLAAKQMIEEGDPNHPVALVARYPNAYPLFCPFFQVSGVGHFTSRRPWALGDMVRSHVPLTNAQQFWVAAPAFMYPTGTPEWSTCPEMRLMSNLAFANGARGWFTYSYHNDPIWLRGRVQRTLTGPFLTFSDLWLELSQRMKTMNALAPLLLKARRVEGIDEWFPESVHGDAERDPWPGIPPLSQHHLRGDDFSLHIIISNNVRDMTAVDFHIPADAGPGMEIYDLTHYINAREWKPMTRDSHLEMFPGQGQYVLMAKKEDCEYWREAVAKRIIASDTSIIQLHLKLAKAYKLECGSIEERLEDPNIGSTLDYLAAIHAAKNDLTDLIYNAPAIRDARSQIIAANSAVCACDGALCRLMNNGKINRAKELGNSVIGVAREFTRLRLELRRGNGKKILPQCQKLAERALRILEAIRAEF